VLAEVWTKKRPMHRGKVALEKSVLAACKVGAFIRVLDFRVLDPRKNVPVKHIQIQAIATQRALVISPVLVITK